MQEIRKYFSFVKISHTVFSMPFALIGFSLGIKEYNDFSTIKLILIVACVFFARNAAMGFNRYADMHFDAKNDRTRSRELPSNKIKPWAAILFIAINSLCFIGSTWFINPLCFYLAPIALIVILGYSLSKRFTYLCHFILGVGLALAPIGAYMAITNQFAVEPVLLSFAVLFWVAGFDIIYALQDEEFDKSQGLHSIPAAFGKSRALLIARISHTLSAVIIFSVGVLFAHHWLYFIASIVFSGALIYQHLLVKPNNLSKINLAFFTLNGFASIVFGTMVICEIFLF